MIYTLILNSLLGKTSSQQNRTISITSVPRGATAGGSALYNLYFGLQYVCMHAKFISRW